MQKEKHQNALDAGLQAMTIAKKAGVTMCLGTDLLGDAQMFQSREFGLRARVLSSIDIVQSATINPARMMGLEDTVGQVREGFSADLLVLRSNPLDDITVLERVESELLAVFKDGRAGFSQLDGVEPLLK
jgi:imidazolonepropionase-like amidohydrolase